MEKRQIELLADKIFQFLKKNNAHYKDIFAVLDKVRNKVYLDAHYTKERNEQ